MTYFMVATWLENGWRTAAKAIDAELAELCRCESRTARFVGDEALRACVFRPKTWWRNRVDNANRAAAPLEDGLPPGAD